MIRRATPVVPQPRHPVEQVRSIRDDHAAFTGCHCLRSVETEDTDLAQRSCGHAMPCRADGLSSVFNYRNAGRCGADSVHVRNTAVKVHRDDRLGSWTNALFEGVRRDAPSIGLDIGEHRGGAGVHDWRGAGDPGRLRHDDFVTGTDVKSEHCQMQPRSSVWYGRRMINAEVTGEIRLEQTHRLRSLAVPVVGRRFGHVSHFEICDPRTGDRNAFGSS